MKRVVKAIYANQELTSLQPKLGLDIYIYIILDVIPFNVYLYPSILENYL